ncbi:MAG: nitronate monooxygenase [Acidobacteria bacterium]|uniref:Nitronate monooxygenase n=1 Tax=Candidatus Polarisedimenticola svalbardensis TaxID=2886004 RepID=A0A8J7CCB6_9BACT|nr:nitronate monooxygenase [Candidatus Polarisedimenticola svalbardensis]
MDGSWNKLPTIIQGGMGVAVSNWNLANAVSRLGQLGVVSGTAIDTVFARRLQLGDPGGHLRRAMDSFPVAEMVKRVRETWFVPGGKEPGEPFRLVSRSTAEMKKAWTELMIVSNFSEVFLAREGHDNPVGINFLEKVQLPTMPSVFGAMLAGVGCVLMGAGIPLTIPGILDGLARWEPVELNLRVEGKNGGDAYALRFDPNEFVPVANRPELSRPKFLGIVSSDVIARTLARKANGHVDGFVVENHTAGGHNAPPRRVGKREQQPAVQDQAVYGEKDRPDLEKVRALGRPFWLAGSYGSPESLGAAVEAGASGIQVGTAFAFCTESGTASRIKDEVLRQCVSGEFKAITDCRASPTGFPFKLIVLKDSLTDLDRRPRERICDLGYLRQPYRDDLGRLHYRCAAEPVDNFVRKGGSVEEAEQKQCLCNGLLATIGLGQVRGDGVELPIVTAGQDFEPVNRMVQRAGVKYTAADVLEFLLERSTAQRTVAIPDHDLIRT